MTDICLIFELHQPFRVKKDFFWGRRLFEEEDDLFDHYFDLKLDQRIFEKVAAKCYHPTNETILELIEAFGGKFRVAYSISGTFIEQCRRFDPALIDSFRDLSDTGCVEFLDQTYYHSLSSLYEDEDGFIEEVRMHQDLMKDLFGTTPRVFENTELLYNDRIAKMVEDLGYQGIIAEGAARVLRGRSPNQIYLPEKGDIKVLLRNYQLTDDIGFRFSSRAWEEYPLTAERYASWLAATPGDCITIFPDYETFGEHHWQDTGIFEFLKALPGEVLKRDDINFVTPSEAIKRHAPSGRLEVGPWDTTSWADIERTTASWIGNTMQWACYSHHKHLKSFRMSEKERMIWHYLGASDHFYYMFMQGGSAGEVHNYFSHFASPYDAFVTYFSVLLDFGARLRGGKE